MKMKSIPLLMAILLLFSYAKGSKMTSIKAQGVIISAESQLFTKHAL
jgi:hypothetical protein